MELDFLGRSEKKIKMVLVYYYGRSELQQLILATTTCVPSVFINVQLVLAI